MENRKRPAYPDFKGLGHSKVGYFKEVRSKLKELEKLNVKLARRHNRLDAIFNSMNDGVAILDRELNIAFFNEVQKKMFPETSEHPMKCHRLFYGRSQQCPKCPALKTLESGKTLRGEIMFKKGRLAGRYYEWTTSPISDALGKVIEIILIMRDITERKDYEFRLMQTDRMVAVGFLAKSLAHEINNPLTSIAGFSEGLLKRLNTGKPIADENLASSFMEYLKIINNEAYRCKEIIQNLRDFNSSPSEDFEPVDIDQVLWDTISLIRQHAKDNRIKMVFNNRLAGGFTRLMGIGGQLKHLFLNLFKQLFTTMAEGGELNVTARNDGEKIEIVLSDPKGTLSGELSGFRNCGPFHGNGIKDPQQMDMSICYNIIRRHRGEIEQVKTMDDRSWVVFRFPAELA